MHRSFCLSRKLLARCGKRLSLFALAEDNDLQGEQGNAACKLQKKFVDVFISDPK